MPVRSPSSSARAWARPVSYTHLDVYKRHLRGSLIDGRVAELRGDLVAAQKLYASGDLTSSTTAAKVRTLGTLIRSASGQSVTVALFAPRGARLDAIPAGSDPPQLDPGTFGALVAQGTERHQIVGSDLVAGFTVGVTDLTLRRATAVVEVSEPMTPIDSVLSDVYKRQ